MTDINTTGVVLLAAGASNRFGKNNKILIDFKGKPLFHSSLEKFYSILPPENIVLVISEKISSVDLSQFPGIHVTIGGATRAESALNGLKIFKKNILLVGVHDAARPYITEKLIKKCICSAQKNKSAVLAKAMSDTLKLAENNKVIKTLPRETVFAAETPQFFYKNLLVEAYEKSIAQNINVTDEAMAMELAGHDIFLVIHQENNSKVTYSSDCLNF